MYTTRVTREDMALARRILYPLVTEPDRFPIRFTVDGRVYRGIPSCHAAVSASFPDSRMAERTFSGMIPGTGLEISAVCREYRDHPAAEWTVYIRNAGAGDSPLITDFYGMDCILPGERPVVAASNGDTCDEDLYRETRIDLSRESPFSQHPDGGRGSDCAWPYSRVSCGDVG